MFAFTVALWVTEALPLTVTALLSSVLLVVVAGLEEKKVFSAYGDTIVPLFIGSFMLAMSMEVSGLGKRIAWLILKQRWATRSPSSLLLAVGVIACVVSLFVSNTATTATLLPIGLAILGAMEVERRGNSYAVALMLMLTWGSSVAVGVPVGTPPNLIGIGLIEEATGRHIGFVEWMAFAMPVTVVMTLAAWFVLRLMFRHEAPSTEPVHATADQHYADLGRVGPAERNTLIAFLITLAMWVVPDTAAALNGIAGGADLPAIEWLQKHLTPAVAALLGATILFALPAKDGEGGRTLSWKQGASIDWGVIMLFGGGIALGQAMFESGLARTLGEAATHASGADSVWTITAICIAAAILLSELASNTAAATALVPVAIGLAEGAGVSPIPPALGVVLGASLGFMLPVSTPPNAIVYSSGLVPAGRMMRAGLVIDLIGFGVTLLCLRLILPALGLG